MEQCGYHLLITFVTLCILNIKPAISKFLIHYLKNKIYKTFSLIDFFSMYFSYFVVKWGNKEKNYI